jgi:hypothetical protein
MLQEQSKDKMVFQYFIFANKFSNLKVFYLFVSSIHHKDQNGLEDPFKSIIFKDFHILEALIFLLIYL